MFLSNREQLTAPERPLLKSDYLPRLRQENVRGAFIARPTLVKNKVVLIIDDVTTTGATLNSCAQSLLDGGAKQVYCLTLAKSILQDDLPIASQVPI